MIGKLRKRIVAINVITACFILFVAVIVTFTWGISRINVERDNRMRTALTFDPSGEDVQDEQNKLLLNEFAIVFCNTQTGEAVWFFGENCDLKAQTLTDNLRGIVKSQQSDGFLYMHIRYIKIVEDNVVKIAFSNLNSRYGGLLKYAWMVLSALVLGLLGHFLISVSLARMALAPVEDSWKKQKQFVADASHELKTPLAVIMANTDIIISHKDETVESQMKWLENTRSESQRMADLVADLLFLAKNDDGLKVQLEDVNLSDCVSSVVLGYEAVFYENKKLFAYEISPDLHIVGNVKQLQQLTTILLDNANKYSLDSGNITLSLAANGKHVQLSVQNDSEQLSEEQLAHLFDRFYTVDPSRNKNNGGNGLGLSIAKIICETHGGNIKVDCVNGVTTFSVTLPLKKR